MFLMNLKTICRWLVMTELEIFINLVGLIVFTILLTIKLDLNSDLDWFKVFLPLFLSDFLQANFCSILFIRQMISNQRKSAILRIVLAGFLLFTRFSFKFACYYLISKSNLNYGSSSSFKPSFAFKFQYASIPLFLHLIVIMFKSCALKKKYQSFY